jgi:hypothetical protein
MKLEIAYTQTNFNAEDTREFITLPFDIGLPDQVTHARMCTFTLSEEALYDLISLVNNQSTATARIRG